MKIQYLTKEHQEVFEQILDEAYVTIEDTPLMRRQLAFVYILSYYQKDYERYEGEGFYIEALEELEIGGPTYLLEEGVGLRKDYPHEYIVTWAKALLKGRGLPIDGLSEEQKKLYKEALHIANISNDNIG